MPSSDYYVARKLVQGFGQMRFLMNLQSAKEGTGGGTLLGSVVKHLVYKHGGFIIPNEHYPEPHRASSNQLILEAIEERKAALGLGTGEVVVKTPLAGGSQSVTIRKGESLQGSVGGFPALPVGVNFSIDYNRMVKLDLTFGTGTRVQHIPVDPMARLYDAVGGDWKQLDPASRVKVDEELHHFESVACKGLSSVLRVIARLLGRVLREGRGGQQTA